MEHAPSRRRLGYFTSNSFATSRTPGATAQAWAVRVVVPGTDGGGTATVTADTAMKLLRFEGHFHGWHDDVMHGFHPPFDADGSLGVPAHVRQNVVTIPDDNP